MKITYIFLTCAIAGTVISSCHKAEQTVVNNDGSEEQRVLTDFANVVANPNYKDIQTQAQSLKDASTILTLQPTDANLEATRNAWKATRAAWETCEGFLFGPVEDNNYDPTMDDWPLNKVDLDSLLASRNQLSVADITPLNTTLKGFHAIEYIIFGVGGTKKASQITDREKVYLASLTQSLYDTTTQLTASWDPQQGNYTAQVINAGKGNSSFKTRKEFFLALVGTMADICNEVANEKMQTPLAARDSTLDESSFSHNSVTDFKNNITGVLNVYTCKYNSTGYGLNQLVAAKNTSLDNKIQSQLNTAISAFSGITTTYEKAIYTQQQQIKTVQDAVNALKTTLEDDLTNFIQTNIKD